MFYPIALVYCGGNMDGVGYDFEMACKILDKDMFVRSQVPKQRLVASNVPFLY